MRCFWVNGIVAEYSAGRPDFRDLALCLALRTDLEERNALRLRLFAGGWKLVLALAQHLRLLPALASAAAEKGLLAGIPALRQDGMATPSAILAEGLSEHAARSAVLRQRLDEVLNTLAARGIKAVLLKGARSLWTGTPSWRSLRDLDLLVTEPATVSAVEAILKTGYHPNDHFAAPAGWHHGAELYRDDLPGWIEIHARAGVRRMEFIQPSQVLVDAAEQVTAADGRAAWALPVGSHILHCLTHHHIGHRGDYFDEIDFKGLFEFASDVDALDEAGRADLLRAASLHPRLMAALDLWLAAATDTFRLSIKHPLRLAPDAQRHWSAMLRRIQERAQSCRPPRRYEGLWHEFELAMSGGRLRLVHGSSTSLGRLILRARALRSLVGRAAVGE